MNLEFLDVSGNGLDRLDALRNCRHLREIRADDNKIKGIEGLWGMDGLVKLRARRNQIESVDFKGSGLKRLTDLDLRGNHLTTLTNLHHLPTLLNLNLDDNHLTTLTSSPVPSLRSLKLQNNLLSTLSLSPFPSLRILYLDSNPLHSLTHTSRCVSLDSVSLRSCSPWTPPQLLSLLRALTDARKIYLSGNDIHALPERGMPRFLNCQLLEMANTGLEEIPRGWEKTFPNLRRCNLNWSGVGEEG
ncbi:L domain-like protein, partial [Ascodesmis nigricans]